MIKLLLIIVTVLSLNASTNKSLMYELNHLSQHQKSTMFWVFEKGKSFDLEYTLTAIAWQESRFGKYVINLNDPSCGVFHIMPRSLIMRTSLDNTSWNRSRLCERLIIDNEFSLSAAILELKYWQNLYISKKYKDKVSIWRHMVASYNGGYRANTNGKYIKEIINKIRVLKIYIKSTKK